jgi:hypothetical protein
MSEVPENRKGAPTISAEAKKVPEKPAPQKEYTDLLGSYKGLSETTTKIVRQAATILETELAAGIKAAKKAEEQFVNVEKMRTEKPDEVIQRFRRDAHEVVDILIDVVNAGLRSINMTSVISIKERTPAAKNELPAGQPSVIKPTHPIKAGEKAEIPLSFENSGDSQTDEFRLYCTDLIGETGDNIPASRVKFNPATLTLSPHQSEKVIVTITVPKTTKSGVYYGLVLAANMNQLRSEIMIKVE